MKAPWNGSFPGEKGTKVGSVGGRYIREGGVWDLRLDDNEVIPKTWCVFTHHQARVMAQLPESHLTSHLLETHSVEFYLIVSSFA